MTALVCQVPAVRELRLHLGTSPDFTAKGWGKRLKAVGGRYESARGYADTR